MEHEVTKVLSSISNSFTFLAQSARGLSGGLAIGWNQSTIICSNSWGAPFGMGIQVFWVKANLSLNILNIYGPCNNTVAFWEALQTSPLLRSENVVIGGDVNFTLGDHEISGPRERVDPLAKFFINLLQNIKMVDLDPQKIKQTWTNRRSGEDRIAKSLTNFSWLKVF